MWQFSLSLLPFWRVKRFEPPSSINPVLPSLTSCFSSPSPPRRLPPHASKCVSGVLGVIALTNCPPEQFSIKHRLWALFFYWHGSVFTHDSSSSGVVNNPAYTLPFISIQSVSCHRDQKRQNTLYNVQPFFFLVCLPVSNILHFLFSWHYTRKEQEFNSKPAHAYFFEFCCFFFFCFNFSTLQ